MNITKTINGNEATIKVEGWLDTQSAPEMQNEIENLEADIESLVIDFSGLEYIASSGVRQVVSAYKKMKGNLVVRGASAGIMTIFNATGIDKKISFE